MKSLSYWKGRKQDAESAVAQARMYYTEMVRAREHARRKVKSLENEILVES